jgi:RNA polymerase sigma factor (TIGR02999 family)
MKPMNDQAPAADLQLALDQQYSRLRALAAAYIARERRPHTLQPTALVHEGLARVLRSPGRVPGESAALLLAVARAMRLVLVDHARRRCAEKRGHGCTRIPLDHLRAPEGGDALDLVALDAALERLAVKDPALARIVELRFFGGLTEPEIATLDGVSTRTITRAWAFARLWLAREIDGEQRGAP